MNPKSVNDLDPKLKDAYERIMGTAVNPAGQSPLGGAPPAAKPAEQPSPQKSNEQAPNTPLMQTQPVVTQNIPPTQTPIQNAPVEPQAPTHNPFMPAPEPPVSVFTQGGPVEAPTQKKKMNLLPIFLIVFGMIFFVVYIFVWARVFGLF